jgi:hypothetical protein
MSIFYFLSQNCVILFKNMLLNLPFFIFNLKEKRRTLKDRNGMLKERIERQRNKLGVREQNLCGCVCLDWAKVSYSAHCPLSSIYSRVQ